MVAPRPSLSQASVSLHSSSLSAPPSMLAFQKHSQLYPLACCSAGDMGQVGSWCCDPAKRPRWTGCCQEAGGCRQMGVWGCPPTGSLKAMGCRGDESMLGEGAGHSWHCASQQSSGHPLSRA